MSFYLTCTLADEIQRIYHFSNADMITNFAYNLRIRVIKVTRFSVSIVK